MNKIELKHLAPYLPYDLSMIFEKSGDVRKLKGLSYDCELIFYFHVIQRGQTIWNYKPLLRPLSDLTTEIEHNGENICVWEFLQEETGHSPHSIDGFIERGSLLMNITHDVVEKLFEWHFDVFDLIPKGMAVNINNI